ncbi:hypothetical protein DFH28DRAFT_929771 [Melampsora americana]|nr:hypothetical protein DFH28DRAFT_929771 [Melampsora americana]
MKKTTKSNRNSRSSAFQKKTQSSTSNNEALVPPQVTPPTINSEDDEDAGKADDPNFVTDNEGSDEENDKTNDVSFESKASPTNGKRNRKTPAKKSKAKRKKQSKKYKLPANINPDEDSDIEEVPRPVSDAQTEAETLDPVPDYFSADVVLGSSQNRADSILLIHRKKTKSPCIASVNGAQRNTRLV